MAVTSAGTFVGAAFETVGYYYQELILNSFGFPLVTSIGGLAYLIAIIIALITVLVQGRFTLAPWLLVGPGIFLATIIPRTETFGVAWMFGDQSRNDVRVQNEVDSMLGSKGLEGPRDDRPAQVSALFEWYTRLISGQVREIVRVLNQGNTDRDFVFVARGQMYSELHAATTDNSDFKELLHVGFLGECRDVVHYGRQLREPGSITDLDQIARSFEHAQNKQPNLTHNSEKYIASIGVGFNAAGNNFYEAVMRTVDRVPSPNHDRIDEIITSLVPSPSSPGDPLNINTDLSEDALEEFYHRTVQPANYTCEQIWAFIRVGLILEAKKLTDAIGSSGNSAGVDPARMIYEIGRIAGVSDDVNTDDVQELRDIGETLNELYRIIASYLLRNEVNTSLQSRFMSNFVTQMEVREIEDPHHLDILDFDRTRMKITEDREKSMVMQSALQLPYYQGLALYFLAVLFPFFSILLLVPGKHSSFLLWFMLYLWVKSWDIGFTVVMMADEVLFAMFDVAGDQAAHPGEPRLPQDVADTFSMISELDSTFNLATYYAMIGTAMHAVPVVSAQLILGGMKGGSGLIAQGMQGYSMYYAGGAMHTSSSHHQMTSAANVSTAKIQQASDYATNGAAGGGAHYGNGPAGTVNHAKGKGPRSHYSAQKAFAKNNENYPFGRGPMTQGSYAFNTVNFRTPNAMMKGKIGANNARFAGGVMTSIGEFLEQKSGGKNKVSDIFQGAGQATNRWSTFLVGQRGKDMSMLAQFGSHDGNDGTAAGWLTQLSQAGDAIEIPNVSSVDAPRSLMDRSNSLVEDGINLYAGFYEDFVKNIDFTRPSGQKHGRGPNGIGNKGSGFRAPSGNGSPGVVRHRVVTRTEAIQEASKSVIPAAALGVAMTVTDKGEVPVHIAKKSKGNQSQDDQNNPSSQQNRDEEDDSST